jgi:UDP-N-acetylglucosamine--N-acetylmuramyl-(pentapeptide) pyrophosphoryl-undecaprenol N-acetylglucosamine transferase
LLQRRPNATIHFVGTIKRNRNPFDPTGRISAALDRGAGFCAPFLFANLSVIFRLFVSLVQSFRLLRRLKPALVVGTGGYVSGPVLYMASLLRISTVIQEQNRYPGVATRWLSARADQVHIAFAEAEEYFKNKDRVHLSGNPIGLWKRSITGTSAATFRFGCRQTDHPGFRRQPGRGSSIDLCCKSYPICWQKAPHS